jgi:hypothetical protein
MSQRTISAARMHPVCSLTLFPPPNTATSDYASKDAFCSAANTTQRASACGRAATQAAQTGSKKSGKGSQKSLAAAEAHISELTLDWSNTCVFMLSADLAPAVQSPPEWPLGCSAAVMAAYASQSILRTDDYQATVRIETVRQPYGVVGCSTVTVPHRLALCHLQLVHSHRLEPLSNARDIGGRSTPCHAYDAYRRRSF